MLTAPGHALNTTHTDHISPSYRNKRASSTSRLSTWRQIRPLIYTSMLCDDKSNAQWLQKQLSSFELLLREQYPKDVVPIMMDDHIRSVLSNHPKSLHKSILKMLFIKIPKLKPDTIFFIPASPKLKPINRISARNYNTHTNSLSVNKQSSDSSSSDGENDGSVIISAHHHKDTLSMQLNPAQLSKQGSESLSTHHYGSSISDSNQVFLPKFKAFHINLTESDHDVHNNDITRGALGLSPSESSKIQGYDYNDDANTDEDMKMHMDDDPETKCSEHSEIEEYHAYGYTPDEDRPRASSKFEAKHAQKASRTSIFDKILKNRSSNHKTSIIESQEDRNRVLSQSIASNTTHLAKRISDIQNKHVAEFIPEDTTSASVASKPSIIHEIDFMVDMKNGKATPYIKSPYVSSLFYIVIYVFNSLHLLSSIWLLLNITVFCLNTKVPIFLQILLYFNISMLCVLEVWKIFAGILFHFKSDNSPKISKLNSYQKWRLQFWIFLPLIWSKSKAAFHMFFMLDPISIEVWFDLCVHHIWMFILCILFFTYGYLYSDAPDIGLINFLSCVLYIITFCVTLIIILCVKLRHNTPKT